MAYNGKFVPRNSSKYLGDPTRIFWRSLWERRVMDHLDRNENVIGWSSEEVVIPYISPIDNKVHRYFPDFFVQIRSKDGKPESIVLEVKPSSQAKPPVQRGRTTKKYITEVMTWGVNEAKWNAAVKYCEDRNWKFKVVTEKDLGI